METPNLKNIGIGTRETPRVEAKNCTVSNVDTEVVEKIKNQKAVFYLKHPARDEDLKVSTAMVMKIKKDKKEIVSVGLWMYLDSDNKLMKDGAVALLLKKYGASNLTEMIGKSVETEVDSNGYLAIKAY